MKKDILVISATLFVVAAMLVPAMGYSITSGSPYPYSAKAEDKPQFTIGTGEPAHNLTNDAFVVEKAARYSISMGTPYQYSIQTGKPYQYSLVVGAQTPVVTPAVNNDVDVATTESDVAGTTTTTVPDEAAENNTSAEENVSSDVANVPVVLTYNITGIVFEDVDANGVMGDNDTPVSGVSVATDGSAAVTGADGSYLFGGLANGDYVVSVTTPEGYEDVAAQTAVINGSDSIVDFALIKAIITPPEPSINVSNNNSTIV